MRRVLSLVGACALVAGGLVALTASSAGALTQFTVTNGSDNLAGSLRQAFASAQATDDDVEIIIPASAGDITLTSGHLLYFGGGGAGTHSLTLRGSGNTITQTAPNERVINIPGGAGTTFTVDNLTITGGVAPAAQQGGGIRSAGGSSVVVTNSTITGNSAPDSGGGIHTGGTLTLTNSTISGNSAASAAGGAFAGSGMTVTGSTISGNDASIGAGLHFDTSATITNSTITGNTSTGDAGGVLADDDLTLQYATIAGNSAQGGSGANLHFRVSDTLTTFGSVIALPLGGGANCVGESGVTSQGYNYTDDDTCGFFGTGDTDDGGDPGLGNLADNGGPTETMHPLATSGLIDKIPASSPCAGVNITVDQRGEPRPVTAGEFCDIGAVEVQVVEDLLIVAFTG